MYAIIDDRNRCPLIVGKEMYSLKRFTLKTFISIRLNNVYEINIVMNIFSEILGKLCSEFAYTNNEM